MVVTATTTNPFQANNAISSDPPYRTHFNVDSMNSLVRNNIHLRKYQFLICRQSPKGELGSQSIAVLSAWKCLPFPANGYRLLLPTTTKLKHGRHSMY